MEVSNIKNEINLLSPTDISNLPLKHCVVYYMRNKSVIGSHYNEVIILTCYIIREIQKEKV